MKKKILSCILAAAMTMTAIGAVPVMAAEGDPVTIKVFSDAPDRKTGLGLIEQMLFDEYMAENPNVTIEVEALDDEPYKTKFKAYTMEGMPDLVHVWGMPSFMDEIIDAGVLEELNEADYAEYGFLQGSLEGFKKDGKLYGLPGNTDTLGFYYNQKMFEEHGWEVPTTYDELLTLAGKINEEGIIPLAFDGGDGWPLVTYLSNLLMRIHGDYRELMGNAIATGDFSDPDIVKAVEVMKETVDAGLFQPGFDTQDYATAKNLFTNGQSAMFYMGSWEAAMATSEDVPEEVRDNIRVFNMPAITDGQTDATSVMAWNGGGFAINAKSEVKEETLKLFNWMYQPDKMSRYTWEQGVGISAQDQAPYMTGDETEVQKQFVDMLNNGSYISGNGINDLGTSAFKTCIETEIQSLCNGSISGEEFLSKLAEACK